MINKKQSYKIAVVCVFSLLITACASTVPKENTDNDIGIFFVITPAIF